MPIAHLRDRAQAYVDKRLITNEMAARVIRIVEQERGTHSYANDVAEDAAAGSGGVASRLSLQQMKEELAKRESMMKDGRDSEGVTDQWRVYEHIINRLRSNEPLRLMVQASRMTCL